MLKCNQITEHMGVDVDNITLSFSINDLIFNDFEIRCASDRDILIAGGADLWRAKFDKSHSLSCRYDGTPLKAKQRVFWQVCFYNKDFQHLSDISFFETGLIDWSAKWIASPADDGRVREFRKTFMFDKTDRQIRKARLYICGLGYFEAKLNGQDTDNTYFKPVVTDYSSRDFSKNDRIFESQKFSVTYYTYDILKLLESGENTLSVLVGDGYYHNTDRISEEPCFSYGTPKLLFELQIVYDDCTEYIVSSDDCEVRNTSRRSTLFEYDTIDFSAEPEAFTTAVIVDSPDGKLISPLAKSDIVEYTLQAMQTENSNYLIFDFGKNHTGGLCMSLMGEKGTQVTVRYAEVLDKEGNPNFLTSSWCGLNISTNEKRINYQESRYVLSGSKDTVAPLFTWHCYRYAVVYCEDKLKVSDIKSHFLHTEIDRAGYFECSSDILNDLHEKFMQTQLCNMHSGLPSDCPHREKLPYTCDGQIVMSAVMYAFDAEGFYRKWLKDILDSQSSDGYVPHSAPNLGGGGGYSWGNAICVVPEILYNMTGDMEVVKTSYSHIIRWLDYYTSAHDGDYIIRRNSHEWFLGDWLAPEIMQFNVYFMSTLCYYLAVGTAKRFADLLGDMEMANKLTVLFKNIKDAINTNYYMPDTGNYCNGIQGENVLPLAYGIVPEEHISGIKEKIRAHYEETGHIDTGMVATPVLIDCLTECGMSDLAYNIMVEKSYPSYDAMMDDETTLSEHWSKLWPDYTFGVNSTEVIKGGLDVSHCHPMFGSVVSWLYRRVAGLDLDMLYAKKILIRPAFLNSMNSAKAKRKTHYGDVSVSWKRAPKLIIEIQIPSMLTGHCIFEYSANTLFLKNVDIDSQDIISSNNGIYCFNLASGNWLIEEK